ncbi:MG2 domain-containing protein, partial [Pyxidicoccus sp. 3LG]
MSERFRRRRLLLGGLAVVLVGGALAVASWDVCLSARVLYGVKVPRCPDGDFRQTVGVNAHGLSRGIAGEVSVWAQAHAPDPRYGGVMQGHVGRGSAELFLVDADGKETPLTPEKDHGWERDDDAMLKARFALPQVPDGDYRLRARLSTPLGTDSVDAALPLYAPARVHVLTDRPLYEPGHEVRFRAVVLRAKDLSPLDGRPGTWTLKDPSGEVVLEERSPAGPWGVVAGSFPLDRGAPTGSGRRRGRAAPRGAGHLQGGALHPAALRRGREQPPALLRAGETPEVEGQVVYAVGRAGGGRGGGAGV